MKKINVYLDDWRIAPEGWVQCWNTEELTELFLSGQQIGLLSLDNDLGLDKQGQKVLDTYEWIKRTFVAQGFSCDKIMVHSANPIAKEHIFSYLQNAQKHQMISKYIVLDEHTIIQHSGNKGEVFDDSF